MYAVDLHATDGTAAACHLGCLSLVVGDGNEGGITIGAPLEAYGEIAAALEALDATAILPLVGQGGQDVEHARVALEQHLGDAGRSAEVTVDLEGGV